MECREEFIYLMQQQGPVPSGGSSTTVQQPTKPGAVEQQSDEHAQKCEDEVQNNDGAPARPAVVKSQQSSSNTDFQSFSQQILQDAQKKLAQLQAQASGDAPAVKKPDPTKMRRLQDIPRRSLHLRRAQQTPHVPQRASAPTIQDIERAVNKVSYSMFNTFTARKHAPTAEGQMQLLAPDVSVCSSSAIVKKHPKTRRPARPRSCHRHSHMDLTPEEKVLRYEKIMKELAANLLGTFDDEDGSGSSTEAFKVDQRGSKAKRSAQGKKSGGVSSEDADLPKSSPLITNPEPRFETRYGISQQAPCSPQEPIMTYMDPVWTAAVMPESRHQLCEALRNLDINRVSHEPVDQSVLAEFARTVSDMQMTPPAAECSSTDVRGDDDVAIANKSSGGSVCDISETYPFGQKKRTLYTSAASEFASLIPALLSKIKYDLDPREISASAIVLIRQVCLSQQKMMEEVLELVQRRLGATSSTLLGSSMSSMDSSQPPSVTHVSFMERGTSLPFVEQKQEGEAAAEDEKRPDCLTEIYSFQKKVHEQLEQLKTTPPSVCDKESWISGDKQTESMVKLAKLCTDVLNGKLGARSVADKAVEAKLSSSLVTSGQSNTSRSAGSSLAGKGSTTEASLPSEVELKKSRPKTKKLPRQAQDIQAPSVRPPRTKQKPASKRWTNQQDSELPSMAQHALYEVYQPPPPPIPSMCAPLPVYAGDVVPNTTWYPAGRSFSPPPFVMNTPQAAVALPALQTYGCWPTINNEVQSLINRRAPTAMKMDISKQQESNSSSGEQQQRQPPRNPTATLMKDRLDHLHSRLSKMESYVEKIMELKSAHVPAARPVPVKQSHRQPGGLKL